MRKFKAKNAMMQTTNTEYGGLGINVTNVVFVHGSIDPWHAMGITNSSSQSSPAIYIEGQLTSLRHCYKVKQCHVSHVMALQYCSVVLTL